MYTTRAGSILLDIEGTTSSISFVYDVMFPFVREHLIEFLAEHWKDQSVTECLPLLADDLGVPLENWLGGDDVAQQKTVSESVVRLMDDDVKATGLKQLQGLIWQDGFFSGQLVAHLFDDVAEAIRNWHARGLEIRIYSSGSVQAQKLFFGHTVAGDLRPYLNGHYDTTIGNKRESASYVAIAGDMRVEPGEVLFISDVCEELSAARKAGMQTLLSIRPGNKPVENTDRFETVASFEQIDFLGALP